jgi:hypothetical protein
MGLILYSHIAGYVAIWLKSYKLSCWFYNLMREKMQTKEEERGGYSHIAAYMAMSNYGCMGIFTKSGADKLA